MASSRKSVQAQSQCKYRMSERPTNQKMESVLCENILIITVSLSKRKKKKMYEPNHDLKSAA